MLFYIKLYHEAIIMFIHIILCQYYNFIRGLLIMAL